MFWEEGGIRALEALRALEVCYNNSDTKPFMSLRNLKFIVFCYFGAKQNTSLHFKIVNGGGNFVRYAVAESAAYLAYVSIYATSKVQNLPARTIFKKKRCALYGLVF